MYLFGGVGVLVQKTDEGDEFHIAFVSKKLNKAQRNYSVTEQECLAAIVCIKRFRADEVVHLFYGQGVCPKQLQQQQQQQQLNYST